jgi:hypothetical protein
MQSLLRILYYNKWVPADQDNPSQARWVIQGFRPEPDGGWLEAEFRTNLWISMGAKCREHNVELAGVVIN